MKSQIYTWNVSNPKNRVIDGNECSKRAKMQKGLRSDKQPIERQEDTKLAELAPLEHQAGSSSLQKFLMVLVEW